MWLLCLRKQVLCLRNFLLSGSFSWHADDNERLGDQYVTYLPFCVKFAYRLRPTIPALRHIQFCSVHLGVLSFNSEQPLLTHKQTTKGFFIETLSSQVSICVWPLSFPVLFWLNKIEHAAHILHFTRNSKYLLHEKCKTLTRNRFNIRSVSKYTVIATKWHKVLNCETTLSFSAIIENIMNYLPPPVNLNL